MLERSKNAVDQYCLFSRAVCSIVDCLCLKPNRLFGINLLISTIGKSLFSMSFSKSLGPVGKRLIGQ
jgi:hypothetical protein